MQTPQQSWRTVSWWFKKCTISVPIPHLKLGVHRRELALVALDVALHPFQRALFEVLPHQQLAAFEHPALY